MPQKKIILDSFNNKYKYFVEKNSLLHVKDSKTKIKYYAKVEKIIDISGKNLTK